MASGPGRRDSLHTWCLPVKRGRQCRITGWNGSKARVVSPGARPVRQDRFNSQLGQEGEAWQGKEEAPPVWWNQEHDQHDRIWGQPAGLDRHTSGVRRRRSQRAWQRHGQRSRINGTANRAGGQAVGVVLAGHTKVKMKGQEQVWAEVATSLFGSLLMQSLVLHLACFGSVSCAEAAPAAQQQQQKWRHKQWKLT